jgi:uncharacterized protein YlzI (FlbEa/FlbD family)
LYEQKQRVMTQEFINKVEESFLTLHKSNGKFYIFEELVIEVLNKDSEKDQIIETVHKILELFNKSDVETQEVLYNSEISDVIKMTI